MFVRLGQHDVPVPGPFGAALHELYETAGHTPGWDPPPAPVAVPGGMPGKPITASQLGERLRALGIYAMPGRRAALTDLAAKMPAAVLADLLHLSPGTAVRWVHQAGGNWSRYAAELPGNAFTRPDECLRRTSPACTTRHDRNTAGYQ